MSLNPVQVPKEVSSEEFNELDWLLDWMRCEWGDEHDPCPIPDDIDAVVEIEEDFDLEDISHFKELSSTEV